MKQKPIVAVLMGDASGVGPEIVARLASEAFFEKSSFPIVVGDKSAFDRAIFINGKKVEYCVYQSIDEVNWEHGLPFLQVGKQCADEVPFGNINKVCGAACIEMIEFATQLYAQGKIDGICYAPLNKTAMKLAKNPAASEIELFALLLKQSRGYGEINVLDGVWTTRVTSHIPVKEISSNLKMDSIVDSIILANETLKKAGYEKPKIGVCALNPHGGENGLCGDEEITLIAPAVKKARELAVEVRGPFSADTLFYRAFEGEFNAVVTMFHDQGQIALKLKGFDRGITIGGGLKIPITTCAHGTAEDIAGKGIATTTSLEAAFKMVCTMAKNTIRT